MLPESRFILFFFSPFLGVCFCCGAYVTWIWQPSNISDAFIKYAVLGVVFIFITLCIIGFIAAVIGPRRIQPLIDRITSLIGDGSSAVDIQAYSEIFRQKITDGKTIDDALAELRASGASAIQCIFAVTCCRRCAPKEAKRLVYSSPAWADEAKKMQQRGSKTVIGVGVAFLVIASVPPFGLRTLVFGIAGSVHVFNYLRLRRKFAADKESEDMHSSS
jgi:hypothetical protein